MWSFVQKKKAKAWVWVVFEPVSRQVITFHAGNRGMQSLKILWQKIPHKMRRYCFFETDDWEAYQCVLPKDQHWVGKAYTYFIEGFFAKVRARVSRLVRINCTAHLFIAHKAPAKRGAKRIASR